jgi:hypothetical protein
MKHRTQPGASRFLGEEFNPFLFAFIGTDRAGGQLSVVSALARLDLDAWAEAASLARLPREVAAGKLAVLLQKFTEIPRIVPDSSAIAARLIALLPRAPAAQVIARPGRTAAFAGGTGLAILCILATLLAMQSVHHAAPRPAASGPAAPGPASPAVAAGPGAGTPP